MRSLFVMDPLRNLHIEGDSTCVLMRECTKRGYEVHYCCPDHLFVLDGQAHGRVTAVQTSGPKPEFAVGSTNEQCLSDFDVVWMRKDPPFDMQYVLATYILDMAHTLVVNDPRGLKLFNEKLWAMKDFAQFQPKTLLSGDSERIRDFVESLPGRAVLKPWDGNGGLGVLVTHRGDRNLGSMIDVLTVQGTRPIIAQEFIEAVERGDKRILLFGGEAVGTLLRVPQARDYRANMHVGATVESSNPSVEDVAICQALKPLLNKWGQLFVGIDVIDGYLTEINVTSPTGIRELNRLNGTRLEAELV
ncbi:MAG: glutathione synthase, partial [Proteobacteria bacterium]|nr:glutathione synthase [Pseudomonadota bacterium]